MADPSGAPVLSLAGKTALVTGGGTGIGKASATALASSRSACCPKNSWTGLSDSPRRNLA